MLTLKYTKKNNVLTVKNIKNLKTDYHRKQKNFTCILINFLITILAFFFLSSGMALSANVKISWLRNQEPDIAGYKIFYGTSSKNYTNTITINDTATSPPQTSYVITGLSEGKTYYFALKAFDLAHQFSDFSEEVSLYIPASTTGINNGGENTSSGGGGGENTNDGGGTGINPPANYCSAQGGSQKYEWIRAVRIGTFSNNSGANAYSDFTSKTIKLSPGQTVSLTLIPGYSGKAYDEYWRVWIDYNNDGDFNDSGELVYAGHAIGQKNASFKVQTGVSGTVRMRIGMQYKTYPASCGTIKYGEIEDYSVTF